ncbi:CLUMA_CG004452, isoform A [Clunio marinus]|uniref:CLUMA_CG004452, isoform A n=1 Tax=Clunio marinus TaxID=568069 RepID=A0A1J1HRQ4_9DIPT|nr:CLUMA_CG004452, isoform A [Clunio marinus]
MAIDPLQMEGFLMEIARFGQLRKGSPLQLNGQFLSCLSELKFDENKNNFVHHILLKLSSCMIASSVLYIEIIRKLKKWQVLKKSYNIL